MLWVRENANDETGHFGRPQLDGGDTSFSRRLSAPIPAATEFHQLLGILWRRRRFILAIAGLGTAMAAVIGLAIPPKFTGAAQLVVQALPGGATDRGAGVSLMDETIDTHVTL